MAREDLVSSAVTFLQDPSVAASPLQKRVEFLQSKNLTQEEIDLAITRSSDETSYQPGQTPISSSNQAYPPSSQQYNRGPPSRYPPYANNPYGPYGEWQPVPPPEPPRRDWRDWFIMATVTSGAAYGLYVLTKRYVAPLISPPTPPQLSADKAAIDEQFSRAFALLDTLSADTATLKSAEEARTERLDKALEEVEAVVAELKANSRRREDETKRLNEELRGLKDGIPKALEGHRESGDKRLRELGTELKSLKVLMGNRFGGQSQSQPQQQQSSSQPPNGITSPTTELPPTTNGPSSSTTAPYSSFPSSSSTSTPAAASSSAATAATHQPSFSSTPGSSSGKAPASIPAWQMAAAANRQRPSAATAASATGSDNANSNGNHSAETS